eukprot:GHRR01002799.1.p1 GENE.GHRR01002799.1~~GHRR01002799.1.p1  ORF type:complete len:441 (+),score=135.39 GHRR01002799.1:229-1551(+)
MDTSRISPDHNYKTKQHPTGFAVQAVATAIALRVGYKLARSAVGKLLASQQVQHVQESSGLYTGGIERAQSAVQQGPPITAQDQWVSCHQPAPAVPAGFKLVASERLPVSVYRFYEQFLSVEVTCLQDHHKSAGQYNFKGTRWQPNGEGNFTRTFDFWQPKKGIASANAHCLQEQQYRVYENGVFVLTTDMHMEQIPYANCFRVQTFWKAEPDPQDPSGCTVSIHVAVPFSQRCMVQGIITNTTMGDCKTFFKDFLAKVLNSTQTELSAATKSPFPAVAAAVPVVQQRPPMQTPFAVADAEVFMQSPWQASTNGTARLPQQQQNGKQHGKQQQQLRAGGAATAVVKGNTAVCGESRLEAHPVNLSRAVSSKLDFIHTVNDLQLRDRASYIIPHTRDVRTVSAHTPQLATARTAQPYVGSSLRQQALPTFKGRGIVPRLTC